MDSVHQERNKLDKLIEKSDLIKKANLAQYRLQKNVDSDTKDQSEMFRKITFGERDKNKPHKVILIVGETGTGKTTLINVMVNYMLGVEREDKVWFEITDDQSDRSSVHSQTSILTVYGVYLQESQTDLTIIDTPGYGDTQKLEKDKKIAKSLLSLSKYEYGINTLDTVCLVIKAQQNRLSEGQKYIFDAVQSLFGRDIAENIVLFFTFSEGKPPRNALMAVEEAKVKCAVNEQKNQPVFFLFDNCQSDAYDEEYETIQEQSWKRSFEGMTGLLNFLENIQPKSLKMTRDVLKKREQLEVNISNLQSRVQLTELKQNELKQTQEALKQNKEHVESNNNFEYEVEVPYKERVDVDPAVAKMAMCCTVCEENCHYPGCWWVSNLSKCSMVKDDHCIVCTNKCHYKEHVKGAKIYVLMTKKETRTFEDLKKKYDIKIDDGEVLVKKLEEELQKLDEEKIKLVNTSYDCVEKLQKIALKTDSDLTLRHIDFLIEKLREKKELEKVKTLENIKKGAEGKRGFFKSYLSR